MELVIAEKPSVARDLARVLGATRRGDGCLEGPSHVVTWCIGHLVELEEPAAYRPEWKRWAMNTLPMLPETFKLRAVKTSASQWKVVRALLKDRRFDDVINACDAGREGELIFRLAYELAASRLPIRRLWISSLTDAAIRAGFAALQPGSRYDALADAARCRSEADWLVGMNATRAFTLRQRAVSDALLSVGRVQTPTLAIVVAREKAIRAFVPRDYWEVLGAFHATDGAPFRARWTWDRRTALDTAELAKSIVARAETASKTHGATVEAANTRTQKVPPPLLFDLTSLQRTANGRYGFSAQRTLDLAQSLYERHKLLTYPRTDSRHLSNDIFPTLGGIFSALSSCAPVAAFANRLHDDPPKRSGRVFNDAKVSDHHAIIPTPRAPDLHALDRDEARLYELVARRFLGVFYPDAEFALTTAVVRVGPDDGATPDVPDAPEVKPASDDAQDPQVDRFIAKLPPPPDRFVAHGRQCLARGWQEVAGFGDDDESKLQMLPVLKKGQRLDGRYAVETKRTKAPRRYTEASLLAAMESAGREIEDEALRAAMKDSGLGTPATRASIIETLLKRAYLTREGKNLVATAMGEGLIDALPVEALRSPELTGNWEARLSAMARGKEQRARFMADITDFVSRAVSELRSATLLEGVHAAPPAPRTNHRTSVGARAPSANTNASAPTRTRTRTRTPTSPSHSPPHTAPTPTRTRAPKPAARQPGAEVEGLRCPVCGQGAILVGNRAWGCARWKDGCRFVVPFTLGAKPVTDAQLRDLVEKGHSRVASFEVDGRVQRARLRLDGSATPPTARVELA